MNLIASLKELRTHIFHHLLMAMFKKAYNHWWYRTLNKLHTYYPNVSPLSWRCNKAHGSSLHIWWDYPLLQPFWKEVHPLMTKITTYCPDYTLAQFHLNHTSLPQSAYKKSLTLHLINAAKMCIPLHWKDSNLLVFQIGSNA